MPTTDKTIATMYHKQKKKHKNIIIAVAICASALLLSCTDNRVFHAYKSVDANAWNKQDIVEFTVDSLQATANYQEAIGIRINNDYPFTTLNIIVEQTVYPSKQHFNDTIDCRLIDEDGQKIGRGQSLWLTTHHLRDIQLTSKDSLVINLRHNMRREMLEGVTDIGVIIEKK